MTDLPRRWRRRFPILEHTIYLNSCSQGALSDRVRAAYARYLEDWDELGSPWDLWVGKEVEAREAFARLVGARPDEVAVTGSVSHAVSTVVSALPIEEGRDTLVYTALDFPTVGQIFWAQERRGLRIVEIPEGPDGGVDLAAADRLVDERTALVSFSLVSYRNGARLPAAELVGLARERGALSLVDGYQGLGAIDVDVGELGADLLTGGALKYLLASAGVAFLWCRSELVGRLVPTQTGWFADEDIFAMDVHDYSPAPDARRFQAGTPPIPSIYAAVAGLGIVNEVGTRTIETHVEELARRLVEEVEVLGATVATPKSPQVGPLVAVRCGDAEGLVTALRGDGIVTSARDGNLRVSLHLYNDDTDLDRFLTAFSAHRTYWG